MSLTTYVGPHDLGVRETRPQEVVSYRGYKGYLGIRGTRGIGSMGYTGGLDEQVPILKHPSDVPESHMRPFFFIWTKIFVPQKAPRVYPSRPLPLYEPKAPNLRCLQLARAEPHSSSTGGGRWK